MKYHKLVPVMLMRCMFCQWMELDHEEYFMSEDETKREVADHRRSYEIRPDEHVAVSGANPDSSHQKNAREWMMERIDDRLLIDAALSHAETTLDHALHLGYLGEGSTMGMAQESLRQIKVARDLIRQRLREHLSPQQFDDWDRSGAVDFSGVIGRKKKKE